MAVMVAALLAMWAAVKTSPAAVEAVAKTVAGQQVRTAAPRHKRRPEHGALEAQEVTAGTVQPVAAVAAAGTVAVAAALPAQGLERPEQAAAAGPHTSNI